MPTLKSYFAKTALDKLKQHLKPPIAEAAHKVLELLNEEGEVSVADLHNSLFPLATTTASANAMLNRLLSDFNQQATAANSPLRMTITAAKNAGAAKRKVWFEGMASTPIDQPTPDLNAIPAPQIIPQQGVVLNPPVVVLLTFNEYEHQAVLKAFCSERRPTTETRDGVTYNELGIHGGMKVIHAISEVGSGGLGAAQQRSAQAIRAWRAKAVIAVGIAFGMDSDKQNIGDVLVSTQLRQYELNRVNKDGSLTPRASSPDASASLLNRIRTVDSTAKHIKDLEWPKLEFGQILTGEKLIDNLDYRTSLKTNYAPEAIGGEMEGSGLYASAQQAKVDWIVVKAICDRADGNKAQDKTKRQALAAENAARVIKAALEDGNLYEDAVGDRDMPQLRVSPQHRIGHTKPPSADCMGLRDLNDVPDHLLEKKPVAALASLRKDQIPEALENRQQVDALRYLLDWTDDQSAPSLFALLGEYGMGKTITCQRLAKHLAEDHATDSGRPIPLYFDLRHVGNLDKGVPKQKTIIEECIARGWHQDDSGLRYDYPAIIQLIDQGAVLILDGLDEVLVKLSEADGQLFTNQLLKLLADADNRQKQKPAAGQRRPRLMLSCRTQYFRSLRDQQNHFTGQERGQYQADDYLALLLLPFSEEQVLRYLGNAMPEADPERLLETLQSVHNLEELSRRPYTLRLISELIPDIERDRASGRSVHAVSLYRNMVRRWLERDAGKHHIKPDHKLRLASDLAAELWRSGRRLFPVQELEAWFHGWLDSQNDLRPRYQRLHPDQLEEDLRTSTFLVRQDADQAQDSGFRFAHTSMQEYFLADYLLEAIRTNRPERWAMSRPSLETLDFLGQMLAEANDPHLLTTLQSWRKSYRQQTSELLLNYALIARQKTWPTPILHGIDLRGAKLRGWRIGVTASSDDEPQPPLDLGPACFASADLRETRFDAVNLQAADFSAARLDSAEFHHCDLQQANFGAAQLNAAIFRFSHLKQTNWQNAETYRSQFLFCSDAPQDLTDSLLAPAPTDRLPKQQHLALLSGHSPRVTACMFSPDGNRLLSSGIDGTLRLWDTASGEVLRVICANQGWLYDCGFSPGGSRLVSAGADGTLKLWDANNGKALRILSGHQGDVRACAFAPDGNSLLSAGNDGTLRLWDVNSGEAIRVISTQREIRVCAFSADGSKLLSAGNDIRLWDAASGEVLLTITPNQLRIWSCALSPDGSRILSGNDHGCLQLWDAASGELVREFKGHPQQVQICAFSPDGSRLLSDGSDGVVQLWYAVSGEIVLEFNIGWGSTMAYPFASDGNRLLSAHHDGMLRVWDATTGDLLRVFGNQEYQIVAHAFTSDDSRLLSAGNDGILRQWDAESGEAVRAPGNRYDGTRIRAFSPDGSRLVSENIDDSLTLWDIDNNQILQKFHGYDDFVMACAFSPSSDRLLSSSYDGTLRLWDTVSGEVLQTIKTDNDIVTACSITPDASRLLSVNDDGLLQLWDAVSGEELHVFNEHQIRMSASAFSPDGSLLLSGSSDGTLRLWDATSFEALRTFSGHHGEVRTCVFAPDGNSLLSGSTDGTLRLWSTASGETLQVFNGHQGSVLSCSYSPKVDRIASTGRDGTLRLWNIATGTCLRIHAVSGGDQAGYAVWSPTDNQLIEADGDAWRWLAWQDDQCGRWPLESYGALPIPMNKLTA